ncbi:MAG: hypothetical protein EXR76_18900 [Myxococcales bacterium]|nr:hypothetical protein [Myxococcales bacterium]
MLVHLGWAIFGYYLAAFGRPNELDWTLADAQLSLPLVAAAVMGTVVQAMRHGWPRGRSTQLFVIVLMLAHFIVSALVLESSLAQLTGHTRSVDGDLMWGKIESFLKMGVLLVLHTHPITGPGPPLGMASGIFGDRNDFCMMLSMSIVMCWYMATLSRGLLFKLGFLAFMPFLFHAILLTESRGGLRGAGVGLLLLIWLVV